MDDLLKRDFLELRDSIIDSCYPRLNSKQKEAATTVDGPLLVLAGAGSGKTTVLVNRIYHMITFGSSYKSSFIPPELTPQDIEGLKSYLEIQKENTLSRLDERMSGLLSFRRVYPGSILAITFTNKAAREMKERVSRLLGPQAENIWISTFHSACVRILRRDIDKLDYDRSFVIYDYADQQTVIKECLKELNYNEKNFPPKSMLELIGKAKDELMEPAEYIKRNAGDFRMNKIGAIYELYQRKLRRNNAS